MTTREALKEARAEIQDRRNTGNGDYLPGALRYTVDTGEVYVRNAPASDGGVLLGVYEYEHVGPHGESRRRPLRTR